MSLLGPFLLNSVMFRGQSLTTPSVEALLKFNDEFMLTNSARLLIFLVLSSWLVLDERRAEDSVCGGAFGDVFFFTMMDTITLLQFYKDKEKSK